MYGIFLYANTQYASNVKTLNITLSETLTTSGALKNNDSVFLSKGRSVYSSPCKFLSSTSFFVTINYEKYT